jgi:serine/threonine-protein phosphatase PGAM5
MILRFDLTSIRRDRALIILFSGSVALLSESISSLKSSFTQSDAAVVDTPQNDHPVTRSSIPDSDHPFRVECLESQIFKPKVPYPEWDNDWDLVKSGKTTETTKFMKGNNATRHILLIRHGQYVQGFPDDKDQTLTELGQCQAKRTGQRLANLMNVDSAFHVEPGQSTPSYASPCNIRSVYVSCMTRAQETAEIIIQELNHTSGITIFRAEPDALLNEGLPAPIIPFRPDVGTLAEQAAEIAKNHDRIEEAFQKYFYRSVPSHDKPCNLEHEFEVFVCHANVIRYFLMRALQLPPEAWLRLSLFNCSITYLMIQPNGYVTARLIGDTGHIPYNETTFSGCYGYNWAGPPTSAQ